METFTKFKITVSNGANVLEFQTQLNAENISEKMAVEFLAVEISETLNDIVSLNDKYKNLGLNRNLFDFSKVRKNSIKIERTTSNGTESFGKALEFSYNAIAKIQVPLEEFLTDILTVCAKHKENSLLITKTKTLKAV